MSRCTLRTEWLPYWCLALAAVVAVNLPGQSNQAQVVLAPAFPVASRPAPSARLQPASLEPSSPSGTSHEVVAEDSLLEPPLTFELCIEPVARKHSPDVASAAAPETDEPSSAAPKTDEPSTAAAPTIEPDTPSASSSSIELTSELIALRDKARRVLAMYYPRHQNSRDNNAWEMMHAIIAYGVDTLIHRDRPGGEKINAIGYLCYNYPCRGERMLFVDRGKIVARRGPNVQGHYGQFLAILAQSHVKSDYPLYVSGQEFTLADLIEHEKLNCRAGEELTFKLIALMHYLDSDQTWQSRDGQQWSIQRLIKEELAQPIRGVACGGTHRLMGFSYAINKRIQRGKPIVGEFRRAQTFINDYHRYTLGLQNPDGSFSTEWFVRRGSDPDIDRRLKTSGHILEWIGFSLSDDELRDPRITKAMDYVATLLVTHPRHTWEIGPLGHALHALAIYDARVFKPADPPPTQTIVETSADGHRSAIEARRATESTR